ncbi:MAG: hypothetical protein WDN26_06420 [Chitinophagaceae bacterium]
MKIFGLFLTLFLIPFVFHAQRSLSGLWTGTISNDSVTTRKDQSFEIALTQYKQKVYGYTRSAFIVNDTLYYIVKRVKGTIDGDICEVKDDEIISCNFPGKLDKGVKITTTFRMNQQDSTWHLAGDWKTNKVKNKFYALSGKVALKEETDFNKSKIFPHLEELNLANDVEFYAASKKPTEVKTVVTNNKTGPPVKNNQKDIVVKKETDKKKNETVVKTEPKKTDPAVVITKPQETITSPIAKTNAPAALIGKRKIAAPQVIIFKSDSLQLSLYDNGEIDGDTVSVLLNGEIILAKQLLKASAIKKTIYIKPGTDEVTLVLYAENLGKYPPNTGLLVIHDGDDIYQVRFSADLQQNAAIVFKRKK